MPNEHFHLTLEGGDAAYWQFLRAVSEAGFDVTLDFRSSLDPQLDRDPDDHPMRQMNVRPKMLSEEVEISRPAADLSAEPITGSLEVNPPDISGFNRAALKQYLREMLTEAIRQKRYTIGEAEKLFRVLGLE